MIAARETVVSTSAKLPNALAAVTSGADKTALIEGHTHMNFASNTLKAPILLGTLAAVSACNVETHAEIYTSDVYAVLETKEALETPLTLAFEAGSESGCQKAETQLKGPLERAFGRADFIGCVNIGYDKYGKFRVPVDLVGQTGGEKATVAKPMHIAATSGDDGFVRVEFVFNREEMIALADSIPEELTRYLSEKPDIILSATIANDLRQDINVTVVDVFADGKPLKSMTDYNLPRRGEVNIALSDVGNASFGQSETTALIGWLPAQTE
ncbi:hypothetical protein AAFO90_17315 [Phaeobacter sp. CAU 1743]